MIKSTPRNKQYLTVDNNTPDGSGRVLSSSVVLLTLLLLGIISASYWYLSAAHDLRLIMPQMVAVTVLIVCSLALLCHIDEATSIASVPTQRYRRSVVALLLVLAATVRLLFICHPPQLSDDVYRYLWDGLQILHGHNPYALAPHDIVAADARLRQLQPLINHPALVTIYPPAAQLLFAASAGTLPGWKLLLLLLDMGSCLIIAKLLTRLGRNPWWLSIYALHPLVVLEGASSAHVDIAALFFVLLGVWLAHLSATAAHRHRIYSTNVGAALCFAVAVMIKLFPALFVPFVYLLLPPRQRRLFIASFMLGCAALVIPFMPQIVNGIHTLQLYACNWEFSAFVFRLLRTLLHSGMLSRVILLLLFGAIVASCWWRRQGTDVDLAALLHLFSIMVLLFLLLTPTLHPWYALYLVAMLPFAPTVANIAMSWSVLLSYQVVAVYHQSGMWQESSLLSFYVFVAPVAGLLLSYALLRWRRQRQDG